MSNVVSLDGSDKMYEVLAWGAAMLIIAWVVTS